MIAVLDCGVGNLSSVRNALDYLGFESEIVSTPESVEKSDRLVLPGVGAFGFMMQSLKSKGLEQPIKKFIESGKPFFGICLGLQVLFESSEESPGVKGLEIFKGRVVKFRKGKVPQVGWNRLVPKKKGLFAEGFVYFVNSYYAEPEDPEIVAALTDYFGDFASAVKCDNVTAVQFHPEKSGTLGLEILRRWLKC